MKVTKSITLKHRPNKKGNLIKQFVTELPDSKLTLSQQITKSYPFKDGSGRLDVQLRYDDQCRNNRNTFAITASEYRNVNGYIKNVSNGCNHELIKRTAPDLAHLIRWHLVSSDGPLHYLENTTYLASNVEWDGSIKERNLDYARNAAADLNITDAELTADSESLVDNLMNRLPNLMQLFKSEMEKLNFVY